MQITNKIVLHLLFELLVLHMLVYMPLFLPVLLLYGAHFMVVQIKQLLKC